MSDGETRKQQIARRLRVSVAVLEQYFQHKQAEVGEEPEDAVAGRETALKPLVAPERDTHENRV